MAISPSRKAAFDALMRIDLQNAHSSEALAEVETGLNEKDRSLCHEIVLGTIRHQIELDREIDILTKSKKLDLEVRTAIRIGLYQIRFLDRVPAYSAINESVELVRRAKKASAAGFTNAVLRRASRERVVIAFVDELDKISVETSHPRWLIERWSEQFGIDAAKDIATANNEMPQIAFRRTNVATTSEQYAVLSNFKASGNVEGCFISERSSAELLALGEAGVVYFQDEGSQLAASIVSNTESPFRILDLCAAPGSKTGSIAMQPHSFLAAGDVSGKRLSFLKQNLAEQGITSVPLCQYDAESELPFADGSFDVVFADVPCSGTGTIRHNPEIRFRSSESNISVLSDKQLKIAENASKLVRPGGLLIYATCSLEIEENESVIGRLLDRTTDFRLENSGSPQKFETPEGYIRTFPHRDGFDGFFIAIMRRKESSTSGR